MIGYPVTEKYIIGCLVSLLGLSSLYSLLYNIYIHIYMDIHTSVRALLHPIGHENWVIPLQVTPQTDSNVLKRLASPV